MNVIHHAPGQGDAIWFLDNHLTVKASTRDGARFGLMEGSLPAGSHTPFHRHHDEDEAFYVLSGTMRIHLEGGRIVTAGPRTFIRIPAGVAHGFVCETAAEMLVFSDPAGFVEFARAYGVPADTDAPPNGGAPDLPRLAALAEKYRIELLGPLPASTT